MITYSPFVHALYVSVIYSIVQTYKPVSTTQKIKDKHVSKEKLQRKCIGTKSINEDKKC